MVPGHFQETSFAPADESMWRALATKALKGADFDDTLVSSTADGLRFGPIAPGRADAEPCVRCEPDRPWIISQRIDDAVRARSDVQLEADVEGGASGLTLCLQGSASAYGFGIDGNDIGRSWPAALRELRLELAEGALPPALTDVTAPYPVHFGLSPLSDSAALPPQIVDQVARGGGTLFRADGRVAHNAGATEAQELAFVLASLTEVLRRHDASGQTMETAIAATEIALSVDQEQFLSIAKCRAMRRLHARLQEACGMEVLQPARLHAETSYRMLTVLDPETNILRNTIAVFAAGVGGADSISVLPHTLALGLPDRFARRVARNTQTVLVDECHLAFVQDPAAGSGAIEQLTDALCDRAWQEFRQIEREGGLKASLSTGAVQARIAKAYSALLDEVRSGKRPLVGTTIYSAQAERRFEVLDKRKPGLDPSPSHLAPIALHSAAAQGAAA